MVEELHNLLAAMPALDRPRLHKLADQISRKADAESFDVVRAMLHDRVRNAVLEGARSGLDRGQVERCLNVLDKISTIFNSADHANLDRKLAFIRALTDIREARV